MIECASCGAELTQYETRCPICGKPTVHYHRQRRCLHCGTPAAQKTKTCVMCGRPVDSLPLSTSFSGSWLGVALGVLIVVGLVLWVNNYQSLSRRTAQAAQGTPSPTATTTPTITPTPTSIPLPTAVVTVIPTPTPRTHVVERGQTLYYIARQYQVSIEEIVALNDLPNSRMLRVGQVLVIPESSVSFENGNQLPPQIVHVIQAGETLSGLSYEYDTSIDAIIAANPGLNLDLIYEGQEIIIPLAMPTSTPTPTPMPTATPTPGPRHIPPDLLSPMDGQVVAEPVLLFNWTATGWLASDEFYVLQLTWPNGLSTEHWTKSSSWRITTAQRPVPGSITWGVIIMRQTGARPDGSPVGVSLTGSSEQRIVRWR